MAGRRKANALKLVLGNPGKRRLAHGGQRERKTDRAQPYAGLPAMPRWLSRLAKRMYLSLRERLVARGALTELDAETLAGFCQAWAEFKEATEALDSEGRFFVTKEAGYKCPHPAFAQQQAALRTMRAYGQALGLDPASRDKLGMGGGAEQRDELSEFAG
jgi:P27 family predicted phage terminase small subunit